MKDPDLLSRFVDHRDQVAFAELVRRHIDFVYAAALRHVSGDRHRAEDVAQEVFADLARKAAGLRNHPCLPGWLYASTRFTAINAIRREQRRANREKEAEIMQPSPNAPEPQWEQIRPIIDDAMQELDECDRQSVLLRFFGRQTFVAIGEQLGLSENAAQKRVDRALDRLSAALAHRGITSTSTALALALAHTGVAAPAALAGTATAAALARVAAGSAGGAGILTFMTTSKILVALGAAATFGFAGGFAYRANLAERQAEQLTAEFAGKLSALDARAQAASRRADAADADTARLLGAIDQARVTQTVVQPPLPPRVPAPSSQITATAPTVVTQDVTPGDTAAKIAARNGLTLDQLRSLNPGTDWARLRVGEAIRTQ